MTMFFVFQCNILALLWLFIKPEIENAAAVLRQYSCLHTTRISEK